MKSKLFKEIILGGGIAGLITAYYNKEAIIIDRGGMQYDKETILGPRFLHFCKETKKVLKELNLSTETKAIKISYRSAGCPCKPTAKFIKEYSKNSGRKGQVTSATMNGQVSRLKVFKTSEKELGKKLYALCKDRIFSGEVLQINLKKRMILANVNDGQIVFSYNQLYNTFPINIFAELAKVKFKKFKVSPIYFAKIKKKKENADVVYCIRDRFYRYTFIGRNCIGEAISPPTEFFLCLSQGKIIYQKRIKNVKKKLERRSVLLVGRYAEHNPKIKINDIIKRWQDER